jgi:hypothetical protein
MNYLTSRGVGHAKHFRNDAQNQMRLRQSHAELIVLRVGAPTLDKMEHFVELPHHVCPHAAAFITLIN